MTPKNALPVGTVRFWNGKPQLKIRDHGPHRQQWAFVNRINWEAVNGPLPKGHTLECLGEPSDMAAENWYAMSTRMKMSLARIYPGGLSQAPASVRKLIIASLQLQSKLNEHDTGKRLPATWKEAKNSNIKRYFTGKPCKYGHIADRRTVNGACFGCMRLSKKKLVVPTTVRKMVASIADADIRALLNCSGIPDARKALCQAMVKAKRNENASAITIPV